MVDTLTPTDESRNVRVSTTDLNDIPEIDMEVVVTEIVTKRKRLWLDSPTVRNLEVNQF